MQQQGLLEYNCASFRKAHLPPPFALPLPRANRRRISSQHATVVSQALGELFRLPNQPK